MSQFKRERMVKLQFSARNLTDLDFFTKSDPFLSISKLHKVTNLSVRVKKTETKNNNLNPDWGLLYLSLQELCDSDFDMKLQIDVFDEDNSKDELIGSTLLSLNDFQRMAADGGKADLLYKNKKRGQLLVRLCTVDPPSFQGDAMSNPTGIAGLRNYLNEDRLSNNICNAPGNMMPDYRSDCLPAHQPGPSPPLYPSLPPYPPIDGSNPAYPPAGGFSSPPYPPQQHGGYPPNGGLPGAYPPPGNSPFLGGFSSPSYPPQSSPWAP